MIKTKIEYYVSSHSKAQTEKKIIDKVEALVHRLFTNFIPCIYVTDYCDMNIIYTCIFVQLTVK